MSIPHPQSIRVLIIDDHGIVRAGLRMGLSLNLPWSLVFQGLDDLIRQASADSFVTGMVGLIHLDRGELLLVSAGHPLGAIALLMLVGFLITLCSETDAFVIAPFSLIPAAKLAFLVLGPMIDLKLFFMYTRVFRPRLMWTIILSVCVQVFLYCYLTHLLWGAYGPPLSLAGGPASAAP